MRVPDDPLKVALVELDHVELVNLCIVYKTLAFREENRTRRAFYVAVAAHLDHEWKRRRRVWAKVETTMLNPETEGEIVTGSIDAYIEDAREQLRDELRDGTDSAPPPGG